MSFRVNDTPVTAAAGATPASLFQIGSNTKAFTSVLLLRLEADGKVRLDDRIGRWLPQYAAWKNVTIHSLLDMTSGIPTYDNDPVFQRKYAADPYHNYSAAELVGAVYPKNERAQFLKGWNYSNTGYILTQMVIERVTGQRYADVLRARIIQPLGLSQTYYAAHKLPAPQHQRLVSGYFFNNDPDNKGLAPLYNTDVKPYSLSWTQAAGGIVATPSDVTRWARVLYEGSILPPQQRKELMSLVSNKTGQPIAATGAADPKGFGLGVAQAVMPKLGRIWYYEGETLGYRVLHAWLPASDTIVTVALNSQPRAEDDKIGDLMTRIIAVLPPR